MDEPTLSDISDLLKKVQASQDMMGVGIEDLRRAHKHLASEVLDLSRKEQVHARGLREVTETMSNVQHERDVFQKAVTAHLERANKGMLAQIDLLRQNDANQNMELHKQTSQLHALDKSLSNLVKSEEHRVERESILADLARSREEERLKLFKRLAVYLGLALTVVEILSSLVGPWFSHK